VQLDDTDQLRLEAAVLYKGSDLYRRHCMHCHGVSGDGRGPTAPWVHPHPRDYRAGKFKFISSGKPASGGAKPRRADLIRTLSKGIEGTSMPAFALLPEEDLEDLVSYVIHLSLRGEVEFHVTQKLLEDSKREFIAEEGATDLGDYIRKKAATILGDWNK